MGERRLVADEGERTEAGEALAERYAAAGDGDAAEARGCWAGEEEERACAGARGREKSAGVSSSLDDSNHSARLSSCWLCEETGGSRIKTQLRCMKM